MVFFERGACRGVYLGEEKESMWELIVSIMALLTSSGVFIAGMNMMSDGIEKSAGTGLKQLLGRISDNRLAGVGIGAGVTAIIQSSAATTVMVIGFVNAGVMTLVQATSIIMGANIGTTVTGILVSLSSLPINEFMALLAFVGVMMTFFKSTKVKRLGSTLCGLGLVFVGLDMMSAAFGGAMIKDFFAGIFAAIDFPLLLILVGVLFTALIQSSSAATGVIIIMAGSGAIELQSALFIVLGSNIGTCVTAALAAMGANVNAKRAALIHLTFNVIGTMIFTVLLWIFGDFIVGVLQSLVDNPQMQIAWFHVVFNVTTTLVLLPFIKYLVKWAEFAIKSKDTSADELRLKFVDDRLLKTPPIALMQVKKEVEYMIACAKANMENGLVCALENNEEMAETLSKNESVIDFTNSALTRFLIKLSALVDGKDEKAVGSYFHVLNDVERIGDHAMNFYEMGVEMRENGLEFSQLAVDELQIMHGKVTRMFDIAQEAFNDGTPAHLAELTRLENEVDDMKRELTANHFNRLANGDCHVELSPYFSSAVSGLERVGDHLVNVGYSILNPTGSQSQAVREAKVVLD